MDMDMDMGMGMDMGIPVKERQRSDTDQCDEASSTTKSVAEMGALNAAEMPAPAPMATNSR